MVKKNNSAIWLLLVVIVGLGLFFYSQGYLQKFNLFAVTPTSGCQFVKNTDNPLSEYSQVLPTGLFTCDYSECIVKGNMYLEAPTQQDTISFRTNALSLIDYNKAGTWIAIDCDPTSYKDCTKDGDLDGFCETSTTSQLGSAQKIDDILFGASTAVYNSKLYIKVSAGTYRVFSACSTAVTSLFPTPPYSPNRETLSGSASIFKGEFNFCPTANYPCCNDAFATSTSAKTFDTSYCYSAENGLYKLTKGQSMTFTPAYEDGTPISNKNILVKNYDCSCLPAIDAGTACSSEQSQCLQCPTGYEFDASQYCNTLDGVNIWKTLNDICKKSNSHAICVSPYTYKKACDGTQVIGSSTCGAFNTQSPCESGKKCYLTGTNTLGVGVGDCKCANDVCVIYNNGIPAKQAVTANSYQECVKNAQNCFIWGTEQFCPIVNGKQMTFDQDLQKCVCNPTDACSTPSSTECLSDSTFRQCKQYNSGSNTCYYWGSSTDCANPSLKCSDSSCQCPSPSTCSIGQIDCIDSTKYKKCEKDLANPSNSCLEFRGSYPVEVNTKCENDQIVPLPNGCAFGTTTCDTTNLQKCDTTTSSPTYNTCVCDTSKADALKTDLPSCKNGNEIWAPKQYDTCYKSEKQSTCEFGKNCVIGTSGAECKKPFEKVDITTKEAYAVNENITNITVQLTDANTQISGVLMEGLLYNGETPISGLSPAQGITNAEGKTILNFNYASATTATLTLKIATKNLATNFETSTPINIKKTLQIVLSCPVSAYVQRDITCTYSVKEAGTTTPVSDAINTIEVLDGSGAAITYTNLVGQIKFQTAVVGSATIKMTSTKDGYITGVARTMTGAQPLAGDFKMLIDNKDYYSYVSGFTATGDIIDTGVHSLDFEVLESGLPMDVLSVDMKITTPSGQDVPLTFNSVSANKYRASYNFQQPGQTYHLAGTIYPKDRTKSDLIVGFALTTKGTGGVSGGTGDSCIGFWECNSSFVIIGGAILIGVIILIIVMRKRR